MAELTLGTIGLAGQIFVSVVHTYRFVATARGLAVDAPVVFWKLRIEQLRFLEWGRFWGANTGVFDAHLENEGIADAACGILKEMERLMNDVKSLTEKYGMERVGEEMVGTGFDRRKNGPSVMKQFKYALKDKQKLESLINDLTAFNDGLYNLLRMSERRSVVVQAQSAVLRDVETVQEIEALQDASSWDTTAKPSSIYNGLYQSAAYKLATRKQQEEDAMPAGTLVAPTQHDLWKRPMTSLTSFIRQSPAIRVLAEYTGDESRPNCTVLVEWKPFDPNSPNARSIRARVDSLVGLLGSPKKPAEVRIPNCLGFVEDEARSRFGYLFELPEGSNVIEPVTLHMSLSRGQHGILPTLGERFELARNLTSAVVRLHDCGWVHGSLSSGNIVFFPSADNSRVISVASPYILGFNYTRPTDIAEPTLEWTSNAIPSPENLQSLYRHPLLTVSNPSHPNFQDSVSMSTKETLRLSRRQRYDMFSVGLLLLEIGLWESLDTIWKPKYSNTPTGFVEKLQRVYLPRLGHRMGATYMWVTALLLGDWEGERGITTTLDDVDTNWAYVVSELMKCQA
ncbi:hypothetical protein N0V90_011864 [Kalmusia sp. IMI 367209]|nr:hypothetical protein N0V90_011864 [Kalmusia sp. IMI 367209]